MLHMTYLTIFDNTNILRESTFKPNSRRLFKKFTSEKLYFKIYLFHWNENNFFWTKGLLLKLAWSCNSIDSMVPEDKGGWFTNEKTSGYRNYSKLEGEMCLDRITVLFLWHLIILPQKKRKDFIPYFSGGFIYHASIKKLTMFVFLADPGEARGCSSNTD